MEVYTPPPRYLLQQTSRQQHSLGHITILSHLVSFNIRAEIFKLVNLDVLVTARAFLKISPVFTLASILLLRALHEI